MSADENMGFEVQESAAPPHAPLAAPGSNAQSATASASPRPSPPSPARPASDRPMAMPPHLAPPPIAAAPAKAAAPATKAAPEPEKFPDYAGSYALLGQLNRELLAVKAKTVGLPYARQVPFLQDIAVRTARIDALKAHIFNIQQGLRTVQINSAQYAAAHARPAAVLRRERLELLARTNPDIEQLLKDYDALAAKAAAKPTA